MLEEDGQQLELIDGDIFFNKNRNYEAILDAELISTRSLVPEITESDMSTTMQQAENMMEQFGEMTTVDPGQIKWPWDGRSNSLSLPETEMRRMDTTNGQKRRRYNLLQNSFTP